MYVYDFSIRGRKLFTISERNYNRICTVKSWITITLLAAVAVSLTAGWPLVIKTAFHDQVTTANSSAMPTATSTIADPRANDVEPANVYVISSNYRFAGGSAKLHSLHSNTTASFRRIDNSDGIRWVAKFTGTNDLTSGPYLMTFYDAHGIVVGVFRLDRTSKYASALVITVYLTNNPSHSPMVSIDGVDTHFEPLGRETYLTEPLG